jgi:hypothetical protein
MDTSQNVAFDTSAPPDEQRDAMGELQAMYAPKSLSELIPADQVLSTVSGVGSWLSEELQNSEETLAKARAASDVRYPSKEREQGLISVDVDQWGAFRNASYYERPTAFGFDTLREMVNGTPVLSAIVLTRCRQVARFAQPQEKGRGMGFKIAHVDPEHSPSASEREAMQLLTKFYANCGWEFDPRQRRRKKRDTFSTFLQKITRESLMYDAAPIETELKRSRDQGIDGFYALDGSTIRLCTEEGYDGDDEIFAVQVVQGQIRTAYNYDDLIYEPRNPRADIRAAGYGMSETELLIRVVIGWLNAMAYNIRGFDSNSIPKGILHLSGQYGTDDVAAFRRYWNSMVKGVNNAWALPVLISSDQESKASFEKLGVEFNEMYFAKWMTFLTSICCAVYGMSPAEINFDSFSGGNTSPLGGSDTGEKLAASKDSGLRPILAAQQQQFSDYICSAYGDQFVFRFTGLDEEDDERVHSINMAVSTVNEMRANQDKPPMEGELGDAPLNPSLIGPWMQLKQQAAQQAQQGGPDFGTPEDEDEPDQADGPDFGKTDDDEGDPKDFGAPDEQATPQKPQQQPVQQPGAPLNKALPSIYVAFDA